MILLPGSEVRCRAPSRARSMPCNGIVTRVPEGRQYRVLGLVAHTSLADPGNEVFACKICGHWHEIVSEAVSVELDAAA